MKWLKNLFRPKRVGIVGSTQEDFDSLLPLSTKIGHIAVNHMPRGTSCGEWTVESDGVKLDHVVEAHDELGYYVQYVCDENDLPIKTLNDRDFEKRVVNAPVTLVYHGDNPRYAHFKPTK